MTEEAAYAIANAIEKLAQAVRANTVAVLLDPVRGMAEADEVQLAVKRARVIEELGHVQRRGVPGGA